MAGSRSCRTGSGAQPRSEGSNGSRTPSYSISGSSSVTGGEAWRDQVIDGLMGLGWSAKDADAAIDRVADGVGDDPDISTVLRDALRSMDRGR